MEKVIVLNNIIKKFKIFADRAPTLKERLVKQHRSSFKEFYALNDVSLSIRKGETVGLIGQNGCGKSTLLKIANRTMYPNSGSVQIKGKVSSLIELGAGFHPELTGRENIYTNASIFGLAKKVIDSRLADIISFAELDAFIDNPVRTYSSGMYARLAFSVAIHVDAEILLIDEILGVGDVNFQAKCASKIYDLKEQGTTIVLVTHDMAMIDKICNRAIWLEKGVVKAHGDCKNVQYQYMEYMAGNKEKKREKTLQQSGKDLSFFEEDNKPANELITHLGSHFGNGNVLFTACHLYNHSGEEKRMFPTGEKITLSVDYICRTDPEHLYANIGFEINKVGGPYIYGTNTAREGFNNIKLKKSGTIHIVIDPLQLLPGEYTMGVAIDSLDEKEQYDHYTEIVRFDVISAIHDVGLFRVNHKIFLDSDPIQ